MGRLGELGVAMARAAVAGEEETREVEMEGARALLEVCWRGARHWRRGGGEGGGTCGGGAAAEKAREERAAAEREATWEEGLAGAVEGLMAVVEWEVEMSGAARAGSRAEGEMAAAAVVVERAVAMVVERAVAMVVVRAAGK